VKFEYFSSVTTITYIFNLAYFELDHLPLLSNFFNTLFPNNQTYYKKFDYEILVLKTHTKISITTQWQHEMLAGIALF